MPPANRSRDLARFAEFELTVQTAELRKADGTVIRLSEQPLRILVALLERPGELVLREDLRKRLWPSDTIVEFEHSIRAAMNRLRQALGDSAVKPRFIETLVRRGYRWKCPVEWVAPESRELNAKIPAKLASIITPALEKDRAARYQKPKREFNWRTAATTAVLLLVTTGIGWFVSRSATPQTRREFRQRQLTVNSSENPVTGGAISPDGKYLAYTDLDGMHLKLVESGEVQPIPTPKSFQASAPNWEIGYWLSDSTHFFAVSELPQQLHSLWNISVAGSLRKIADDADPWGTSPDESLLAVTRRNDHEIWLIGPNGEHERKLFDSGDGSSFRAVQWSPDGQRVAYIRSRLVSGKNESQIEIRDLSGGPPIVALSGTAAREVSQLEEGLRDLNWLPDGRLIYVGGEPDIHGMSCNLWAVRVEGHTGKVLGKPERLTNWAGFCVTSVTLANDGKKMVFNRSSDLWTVYVADFNSVKIRLSEPKRLTFTDDLSSPTGWTPDGSAVLIRSNREGSWGIYKQPLNRGTAESLVTKLQDVSWSTPISPDGKWLIYGSHFASDSPAPDHIMRVPMSGGPPQEIARGDYRDIACPTTGSVCVLAEITPDGKQFVFSVFDPMKGKGRELARFADEHADQLGWDLSPDGCHVVITRDLDPGFRVFKLNSTGTVRQVRTQNGTYLRSLRWAADGKGLFASAPTQHGADFVYVDLQGRVRHLWELKGHIIPLASRPSRDGRHLAIQGSAGTSNMWMVENF